jgi:hypothetical protein
MATLRFREGVIPVTRFHWHKKLEETKIDMGIARSGFRPAVDASFMTAPTWQQVCALGTTEGVKYALYA